jgi:hypothetical protein
MTPDLARASHAIVTEALVLLDEYPVDEVDPDSVAEFRQEVDLVVAGRPVLDPPTAIGLLVDLLWWLDTCVEDVVGTDAVVEIQEGIGIRLDELPDEQRGRLIEILGEMAAAEKDEGRRYQMRLLPYALDLVEGEPEVEEPSDRSWVPSRRRAGLPTQSG